MEIIIGQQHDGKMIRTFVRGTLGFSRAALTALKCRTDGIVLNGACVTVRACLHAGDVLRLAVEDRPCDVNENIVARPLALDILYEDENLICVNKGANMPTHPTHGHFDDTLANALAHYFSVRGVPFVFRAVGRLDRDTSGVVIIAKNQASADYLSSQVRARTVTKRYFAVVHGITPDAGRIEGYIRRAGDSIITRVNASEGSAAEYALTEYRTIARGGEYSLVEAEPVTGRTHQLRVHFSGIGHPICGDTLYGVPDGAERQMLHAARLAFLCPFDAHPLTVEAPMPEDMKNLTEDMIWIK